MSGGRSRRRKARWGQNFLVNAGVAQRIVAAAGDLRETGVVEVGPGHGALTRLLAPKAARLIALEIDPALADEQRSALGIDVRLLDAVQADWPALCDELGTPSVRLVSNLPYESGTAILSRWLAASAADFRLDAAVVMLQREVAERVAGAPRTKEYGALAVIAQSTHRVSTVMDVAPGSFRPPPQVTSRVIRLDRLGAPAFAPSDRAAVESLVHAAFAQRRKQAAGQLAGRLGLTKEQWQQRLAALGHDPAARAEEVPPRDWARLALETS